MQLPLQIGENVTWWTTPGANATVMASEILDLMGREINCWEICCKVSSVSPDPKDLNQTAWFDTSTGHLARMIEYETDEYLDISIFHTNIMARETVHNLNTGLNYTTIQEAIDAPETMDGHTIFVDSGIYHENVIVNKPLLLFGENRLNTIIDGSFNGTVLSITANGVTIAGFTIQNSGNITQEHGVSVLSSSNNISGNIITNNFYGMDLRSSTNLINGNEIINNDIGIMNEAYVSGNVITASNITGNRIYGVFVDSHCFNHTIAGDVISNNHWGIWLRSLSFNNTISENTIRANEEYGVFLEGSINNTVRGNTVVDNGGRGISLENSSHENTILGNNVTRNYIGIGIFSSFLNTFRNNHMIDDNLNFGFVGGFLNLPGYVNDIDTSNTIDSKPIYYWVDVQDEIVPADAGYVALVNCTNITIQNLTLTNGLSGVMLAYTKESTITANNLVNNSAGVRFYNSYNNSIYHNNFVANQIQTIGDEIAPYDKWYLAEIFEGNYWDNYVGHDSDQNGIGDVPYTIYLGPRIDKYPLMGPYRSFSTSLGKNVNVISNSTVESFEYFESNSTIRMHVSNMTANQTQGFIRMSIPHEVMYEPFNVTIDGANPIYWNYTLYDNETHRWIYFSYQHSRLEIIIVPEFPSFLILPLFMTLTLLTVIICKRRHTRKSCSTSF
jgi:parallel beta-helix repeat protein